MTPSHLQKLQPESLAVPLAGRKKVLCVIGTRPEAIKMAPVIQALRQAPDRFITHVCSTGQHRAMLDQVLDLFKIAVDYELSVMQPDQNPASVAGLILQRICPVLVGFKPDWLLVQGDTVTVTSAALAAFYHRVKVGHVEAGLRTDDRWQPFPEEINRRVAGAIAERHFAATPWAKENLIRENVNPSEIVVTGNTVIDALHAALKLAPSKTAQRLTDVGGRRIILVTLHRRENLGNPLTDVIAALRRLCLDYRDSLQVIFPVHLNPNVQQPVRDGLGGIPNISLVDPLDYGTLIHVLAKSHLVLTDSGGLQEEAPSLGKPVLVMRRTTERPEAVDAGTVKLVGTDTATILGEARSLLEDPVRYNAMSRAINPYGDGHAAERIIASLSGNPLPDFAVTENEVSPCQKELVACQFP